MPEEDEEEEKTGISFYFGPFTVLSVAWAKVRSFLSAVLHHRRCRGGFRQNAGARRCAALRTLRFLPSSHFSQMSTHFVFERIRMFRIVAPKAERRISFAGRKRIHRRENLIDDFVKVSIPETNRISPIASSNRFETNDVERT